ncbi:bifunctional folylpolyglutamate synthase/dihydrofolate synthase [Arcticibacterium luteifluviistationis]|uniref:Dihydrofolate synthase/folylpolyglutamate synthase n=1 Tax=Arcticibacterium luteifluviistationis TaxID=1784714 RepID=A0A2Z4G6U3_9BACT|nr:folylpolyglutamate synthase/dihydrofolate synthase family protein [Arcticibacterium luteifluviistationis]AWV96868.1 dihydrofolate synthase [Arcticibacterium luteifluviistationis]
MNYQETVQYLYAQLPAFQNEGKKAIKPTLANITAFCSYLGNPQESFKSIHVAGTNGKGSSSHMLASIFQEAGYKTGLYTSPHLKDFRERFRINGDLLSQQSVIDFVQNHQEYISNLKPSFFEVTVAMAFDFFSKENVDIAIIETGLGGRFDSTNIIKPLLSLITNIGFDHTDVLGNTLEKIAFEKAGIIKDGVPVVISERQPETSPVFKELALARNSELCFAQDLYYVHRIENTETTTKYLVEDLANSKRDDFELDLRGSYQKNNLIGLLASIQIIKENNAFYISIENIKEGLRNVVSNTGLKGRWQKLSENPLTICDTGHNGHAFTYLKEYLSSLIPSKVHFILGFAADKNLDSTLGLLPKEANYYFSTFNSPRSKKKNELIKIANYFNIAYALYFADVNEAIRIATEKAKPGDFIYIGGSTYLVAEIENL